SGGTQTITVARGGLTGAVNVNYAFTNGTAINGTHFVGANGSLHWDSGDNSTRTISVDVIDDAAINAGRTFTVTLSGATGAVLAAPTATAVTIADDDNTVQFSAPTATVAETAANATLTLTRMGVAAGQSATVHWSAVNGTAIAGTDYGLLGNGTPTSGDV